MAGRPACGRRPVRRRCPHEERARAGSCAGGLPSCWWPSAWWRSRLPGAEAARRGITDRDAPEPLDILPDAAARAELGSLAATLLDTVPLARALFADLAADVRVPDEDVGDYYARNGQRFAEPPQEDAAGWRVFDPDRQADREPLSRVRPRIEVELRGAAGRQRFARWLDAARADLVRLRPGFEHPGDPGQPDNTHRH